MKDITTMQVERDTLQKLRVVASLEKQTAIEWLTWAVDMAYQASLKNKGRKAKVSEDNPFRELGKKVKQYGELPPGYKDSELE